MKSEAETIEKVENFLKTDDFQNSYEVVSLILSIKDEEDRNWQLFKVVEWLLKNDDWQKAHGIAQLISDGYEKSDAMRIIADKMVKIGQLERALFVFAEAEYSSESENLREWQQTELLHKIAESLKKNNAIFRADEIWKKSSFYRPNR